MSRRDDIQKRIAEIEQELQTLENQPAVSGNPFDILSQIEDKRAEARRLLVEIKKLRVEIKTLPTTPEDDDQQTSGPKGSEELTPRIFLCHADEDKPKVQKLYHQLKEAGYYPWLDNEDLLPGQDRGRETGKVIRDPYNIFVACLSPISIAKRGPVQQQVAWALDILEQMPEDALYFIPALLEPCQIPDRLTHLQRVHLFESGGFDKLRQALDFEISKRREAEPTPISPSTLGKILELTALFSGIPLVQLEEPELPKPAAFGLDMVRIPAGRFLMGTDRLALEQAGIEWRSWMEDETPQHSLELPAYYIGRYPVTNAQFAPFIKDGGYRYREFWTEAGWQVKEAKDWREPGYWGDDKWNKPDHPVVGVSWYECVAYCRWLSARKRGSHTGLPTEAEWEKAARGSDGRIWPWGHRWNPDGCNTTERGPGQTTMVGHYSPKGDSPYGVADMVGNVWEWCATEWQKRYPYPIEDEWSKAYLNGTNVRVLRGGSWGSYGENNARCACRDRSYPYYRSNSGG